MNHSKMPPEMYIKILSFQNSGTEIFRCSRAIGEASAKKCRRMNGGILLVK